MVRRLCLFFAAVSVFGTAFGFDGHPLMSDVQQHLDLARESANRGRVSEALAHAAVVSPGRVLRVHIDCSNMSPSDQGPYRNALSGAFRMWQEALDEQVFELTETGNSDVVVSFQPSLCDRGTEVCGRAHWTRGVTHPKGEPIVVFRADVQVRMVQPDGQALNLEQLRACIAHELGHVLGLDDSKTSGELMSRMDFSHPAISIHPEEVEALIRAREEASHIRQSFADRSAKFKR